MTGVDARFLAILNRVVERVRTGDYEEISEAATDDSIVAALSLAYHARAHGSPELSPKKIGEIWMRNMPSDEEWEAVYAKLVEYLAAAP